MTNQSIIYLHIVQAPLGGTENRVKLLLGGAIGDGEDRDGTKRSRKGRMRIWGKFDNSKLLERGSGRRS